MNGIRKRKGVSLQTSKLTNKTSNSTQPQINAPYIYQSPSSRARGDRKVSFFS